MRPAQLRRFAPLGQVRLTQSNDGFNEAGAAAPVCLGLEPGESAIGPASMRPAQLRRFARPAHGLQIRANRASMRPAQLRRFAKTYFGMVNGEGIASMRPAQLRRFALPNETPP